MTQSHEAIVKAQYGPRANAYVESTVHAGGEDLDRVEAIARQYGPRRALDLALARAGGGADAAAELAAVVVVPSP